MWPLLILSVIALVVFVERALYLHRNQIKSREFLLGIENSLSKGRLIEALTVCQETLGPAAAMVKAGLLTFRKSDAEIRESVREAAMVELGPIKRRVGVLAAFAHAGPLFGVLGTVIGLIDAFTAYQHDGVYVNAGNLAAGAWQALISSATGIALGIVCLLGHHFLIGRIRAVTLEMEWLGQEFMAMIVKLKADASVKIEEPNESSSPEA